MSQWSSRKLFWQSFGRLRLELVNFCCVSVPSLAAPVNVYRLRNDYALYEVRSDGVDTVGVWGSNPHAPTNPFNKLRSITTFSVAPKRST